MCKINKNIKIDKSNKDVSEVKILGFDQGTANLGYVEALIKYDEDYNITDVEKLKGGTLGYEKEVREHQELNFQLLAEDLENIIKDSNAELVFTELIYGNWKAIVNIQKITGLVELLSSKYNKKVGQVAPPTVKKQITGNGHAKNEDMEEAMNELMIKNFGIEDMTIHEIDAMAIAISGFLEIHHNKKSKVTESIERQKKLFKEMKEGNFEIVRK